MSVVALMLFAGCCGSVVSDVLDYKDAREKTGTVTIDASDTTLNTFTGDKKELLLRYLCSSAEWRVTRFGETPTIEGTIVALRRAKGEDGWFTTLHGYIADFTKDTLLQSRVMLRLEPYKPRSEDGWIRSDLYDKGSVGDDAVELNVYKPEYDQPGIESYLVLEGEGTWLEIYEQAKSSDRAFTQRVIDEINEELGQLMEKGLSPSLLPPGSAIIADTNQIIIDDGLQPGIYNAHGYVNPGKPGWIYFKVFNTQTGVEVMYEMEQKRTIEYVGWSSNPKEKFFFDCEAWCKEGDWEHEYPARFELWFVPEDGSTKRLLATSERRIYGWER
ncbi:hypothetical protein JXM67_14820 [candidate division WOR-3 bacterium]|nr:hypothetical protein [candidate division WOR-3 bacterium]